MFNPFFQKYLGRGLLFFIPGTKDSKRKKKQRVLFLVSERFSCNACTCASYKASVKSASGIGGRVLPRKNSKFMRVYTCAVSRALCLEYRVSWVRVPPEAAHFF